MATFDTEFAKAISKFSSMGASYLELDLAEQILVSTELNVSNQYPNMKQDTNYQTILANIKALAGFHTSNPDHI
jgi:hypothetical protein